MPDCTVAVQVEAGVITCVAKVQAELRRKLQKVGKTDGPVAVEVGGKGLRYMKPQHVPQQNRTVPTAARQLCPVRRKHHRGDRIGMSSEGCAFPYGWPGPTAPPPFADCRLPAYSRLEKTPTPGKLWRNGLGVAVRVPFTCLWPGSTNGSYRPRRRPLASSHRAKTPGKGLHGYDL